MQLCKGVTYAVEWERGSSLCRGSAFCLDGRRFVVNRVCGQFALVRAKPKSRRVRVSGESGWECLHCTGWQSL